MKLALVALLIATPALADNCIFMGRNGICLLDAGKPVTWNSGALPVTMSTDAWLIVPTVSRPHDQLEQPLITPANFKWYMRQEDEAGWPHRGDGGVPEVGTYVDFASSYNLGLGIRLSDQMRPDHYSLEWETLAAQAVKASLPPPQFNVHGVLKCAPDEEAMRAILRAEIHTKHCVRATTVTDGTTVRPSLMWTGTKDDGTCPEGFQ
jgi:hypothetical protein